MLWRFSGLAILVGLCIWLLSSVEPQYGIDLQGGTELTYMLDLSRIEGDRSTVASEVKDTIARRLNAYGLKEISVSIQGQDQLVIQLPGTDAQTVNDLKNQIEKAGNLTFRLAATSAEFSNPERMKQLEEEERTYLQAEKDWIERRRRDPAFNDPPPEPPQYIVRSEVEKKKEEEVEKFVKRPGGERVLKNSHHWNPATNHWEPDEIVSGRFLSRIGATMDEAGWPAVAFEFQGEGAAAFADLTGANKGQPLAILLDDDIMQVATIQEQIAGQGRLTGRFTDDDVKSIVTILRGGSLPTKPSLISESTVGSVLGQDSIRSGLLAVMVGLAGVLLVMAVYYMVAGMVANFALALNLLLIMSFVVCFRQTLTLPGIAGMLLTLAMAVDANILIFERFREEKKKGKNLSQSLGAAYQRAFWVIFDSNLTTIITGYVLYYLGTGPVKGFAVTLISGIFASFFTSVYVTRLIFQLLSRFGLLKDLKMMQAFDTPRIPFTKYQKSFIMGSVVVIAVTWLFVLWRGQANYGIDFTGGARVTINLNKPVRVEFMRELLRALAEERPELFRDYSVQTLEAVEPGLSRRYAILTRAGARTGMKETRAQEPARDEAGKGETPAPNPTPPATQPEVQPPTPVVVPAPPPADTAPKEPAQLVRDALEGMLRRENLLLPPPFPSVRWEEAPGGGGNEALVLDVELLEVSPEVTPESLQSALNAFLEKQEKLSTVGRTASLDYKGIAVELVSLAAKADDMEKTRVTRFTVRTTPYKPPVVLAITDRDVPTKQQVEDGIKDFFRKGAPGLQFRISEPFPQVATVGPRVASSLQTDAIMAVFISIIGIVFYLALRFEFNYGLAGVVALVHDVMVAIGVMAVADLFFETTFPVKLNLNELAAILTIIGFSINDSIVLFDRIRENLEVLAKRKLTLPEIVDISVNQTLSRTLWTSVTVFFVTVVLLGFGGESVRGFAFIFAVGTVAGVYSTVFIAAPIAIWLHNRTVARRMAILEETT